MEIKKTYKIENVAEVNISDDFIIASHEKAGFISVNRKNLRPIIVPEKTVICANATELFHIILAAVAKEFDIDINNLAMGVMYSAGELETVYNLLEVSE